ncbi:MAG: hypothetical protein KME42_04235 [Tildeniella nuda ZEHNDER 1965/U140]|nr:hypothetical protein [Tildeniella nuda ZEHNDER 1965/U140]
MIAATTIAGSNHSSRSVGIAQAIVTSAEAVVSNGEAVVSNHEAVVTNVEAVITYVEAVITYVEVVVTYVEAVVSNGETVVSNHEAVVTYVEAMVTYVEAFVKCDRRQLVDQYAIVLGQNIKLRGRADEKSSRALALNQTPSSLNLVSWLKTHNLRAQWQR